MNHFEISLLYHIVDIARPLRPFFSYITHLGDGGIFFIIVGLFFMCFSKTRKKGFYLLLTLLVGFIVGNLILKNIVHRTRPYIVDPSIVLWIKAPGDYSFPSGHTLVAFETYFFLHRERYHWIFLILAILIALSRMVLMVHYPTDVLGGFILGAIVGLTMEQRTRYKREPKKM